MANEVKLIVKEIITNSTNEEVSIDEIFETNSDFNPERNRIDVIKAMKSLEIDLNGVLAIGRKGKKTRFIKNAIRVKNKIDETIKEQIRQKVLHLKADESAIIESNGDLVINNETVYSDKNRIHTIDCLKDFQEEGIGKFIIGRRGAKSRFVKDIIS